jgi:cobalt-zinc-cadmium resistance protein CzcA
VQRPVFYAIAIIITAYLPIFTLQAVEGRLFKPMAWTVAFALLGALIYSMSWPRCWPASSSQGRQGVA